MGFIQNFVDRKRADEGRRKLAETDDKIFHDIERKKMSHNEREMAAILNTEKEQCLQGALRYEERRRRGEERLREMDMFSHGGFNLLE